MKISITRREHDALHNLRGMPTSVHLMVFAARFTPSGAVLEGSRAKLDALVAFIGEELGDGLVSPGDAPALASLCAKIDPDCLEWLGM